MLQAQTHCGDVSGLPLLDHFFQHSLHVAVGNAFNLFLQFLMQPARKDARGGDHWFV
jgi:hypothetical protein